MGKSYFVRKDDAPVGDFYSTPMSLVWELLKVYNLDKHTDILEPCSGQGAIVNALESKGFDNITSFDLHQGSNKQDFLTYKNKHDVIFTNPPFSMFDLFVEHSKDIANKKIIMLGRLNYFASVGRLRRNLWSGLTEIYAFDRMVDFRTPYRDDGLYNVGGMVTCWFIFDKESAKKEPTFHILDIQEYAKLGQFKE